MDTEEITMMGFVIVSIVFVVFALVFATVSSFTDRYCLSKGWANSKTTITFSRYCINRINQTDVVKPIDQI